MEHIKKFRNSLRKKNKPFDPNDIVEKYIEFAKRNDTFRSLCEKPNQIKTFGLSGRSGSNNNEKKPEQKEQKEKKLCKALFNTYKPESNTKMRIEGYGQYIVDYETPLKNKNTAKDKSWGEIDLVGFIQSSSEKHLCFWEVKYGEAKPIHYAVMQLLIYYAQFDRTNNDKAKKNFQNFLLELAFVRGVGLDNNNTVTIHQDNPVLFIAGDKNYFNKQWKSTKTKQRHIELKKVIEKELKLKLEFLQIGTEHPLKNDDKRYYYDEDNELEILP